jgi:hypothetical protein
MRFAQGVPLSAWSSLLAPLAVMPLIIASETRLVYPILALQLGLGLWLAVASSHVAAVGPNQRGGAKSFVAILAILAIAPIGLSILSQVIASANGCYVTEHATYTRATDGSYDTRGCRIGIFEAGSLLHAMHMAILGFIATWAYWIALLFLAGKAIFRAVRGRC